MKIAMMVRGYIAAPGPKDIVYAPIDLAIAISEGLAKKGHKVDFYGPSGTKLNVNVRTRGLRSLVHNEAEFRKLLTSVDLLTHYVPGMWDQYLASEMFARAKKGEYDLLHFQHAETALPYARLYPKVPVVYTLNDPIFGWYNEIFEMFRSPNQFFIAISDNQRSQAPHLQFAGTVHNGINTDQFKFSKKPGEYLLYAGRIVPEKGVHVAVEVAQQTGLKLLIAGPIYDDKKSYFNEQIKPHLNDQIQYLGLVEHQKLVGYMQKAKAFLAPVSWDEPFGLTLIEAMACGAPVIAFRRGSIPEVIKHGRTGFIVDNVKEMVNAVGMVDKIDRADCREHVLEHFSQEIMINNYEEAYKNILRVTSRKTFPSAIVKRGAKRIVKRPKSVKLTRPRR